MKKIISVLTICFLFVSCFENREKINKESVEKNVKNQYTFTQLIKNKKFIKLLGYACDDYGIELKNWVDEFYTEDLITFYDDFNKEEKKIVAGESELDKIKVELFIKFPKTENELIDETLGKLRGNIVFNCITEDYFYYTDIVILTDKNRYSFKRNITSSNITHEGKKTVLSSKHIIDTNLTDVIFDIAKSNNVRIRFTKDDNNKDFILTEEEITKININAKYILNSFVFRKAVKKFFEK